MVNHLVRILIEQQVRRFLVAKARLAFPHVKVMLKVLLACSVEIVTVIVIALFFKQLIFIHSEAAA